MTTPDSAGTPDRVLPDVQVDILRARIMHRLSSSLHLTVTYDQACGVWVARYPNLPAHIRAVMAPVNTADGQGGHEALSGPWDRADLASLPHDNKTTLVLRMPGVAGSVSILGSEADVVAALLGTLNETVTARTVGDLVNLAIQDTVTVNRFLDAVNTAIRTYGWTVRLAHPARDRQVLPMLVLHVRSVGQAAISQPAHIKIDLRSGAADPDGFDAALNALRVMRVWPATAWLAKGGPVGPFDPDTMRGLLRNPDLNLEGFHGPIVEAPGWSGAYFASPNGQVHVTVFPTDDPESPLRITLPVSGEDRVWLAQYCHLVRAVNRTRIAPGMTQDEVNTAVATTLADMGTHGCTVAWAHPTTNQLTVRKYDGTPTLIPLPSPLHANSPWWTPPHPGELVPRPQVRDGWTATIGLLGVDPDHTGPVPVVLHTPDGQPVSPYPLVLGPSFTPAYWDATNPEVLTLASVPGWDGEITAVLARINQLYGFWSPAWLTAQAADQPSPAGTTPDQPAATQRCYDHPALTGLRLPDGWTLTHNCAHTARRQRRLTLTHTGHQWTIHLAPYQPSGTQPSGYSLIGKRLTNTNRTTLPNSRYLEPVDVLAHYWAACGLPGTVARDTTGDRPVVWGPNGQPVWIPTRMLDATVWIAMAHTAISTPGALPGLTVNDPDSVDAWTGTLTALLADTMGTHPNRITITMDTNAPAVAIPVTAVLDHDGGQLVYTGQTQDANT